MPEVDEPSPGAFALLDYRVGEVEKRVETMGKELTEVARQVTDIPGFISRKFDEQRATIAQNHRTQGDRLMQIGTLAAAIITVGVMIVQLIRGVHP